MSGLWRGREAERKFKDLYAFNTHLAVITCAEHRAAHRQCEGRDAFALGGREGPDPGVTLRGKSSAIGCWTGLDSIVLSESDARGARSMCAR